MARVCAPNTRDYYTGELRAKLLWKEGQKAASVPDGAVSDGKGLGVSDMAGVGLTRTSEQETQSHSRTGQRPTRRRAGLIQ